MRVVLDVNVWISALLWRGVPGQIVDLAQNQQIICPGDEYKISVTEDSIVLKKIQPPLDLNEWFRRIEELGPDPNQPTVQEISEMVKEVRREQRSKE